MILERWNEYWLAKAQDVRVMGDELIVALEDGRTIAVPLVWYPRLLQKVIIGKGSGNLRPSSAG